MQYDYIALQFAIPLLLIVPALGLAQEPVLQITVNAQTASVPSAAAAKRHWIVNPLPEPSDVLTTDTRLKQALISALQELKSAVGDATQTPGPGKCAALVAEKNTGCSLIGSLQDKLAAFHLLFIGSTGARVLNAPPAEQSADPVQVTLRATFVPPAVDRVVSLSITVFTANFEALPASSPEAKSATRLLGALASEFGLTNVSDQSAQIPVEVRYSTADLAGCDSQVFTSEHIEHELFGVAAAAFTIAQKSNLLPGAQNPDSRRTDAENQLQAMYNIPNSHWPEAIAKYGSQSGGDYEFAMRHLHVAKCASVRLMAGDVVAFNNDLALQKKLDEAGDRIRKQFQTELDTLAGVIPSSAAVLKIANDIKAAKPKDITGPVMAERGVLQMNRNGMPAKGFKMKPPEPEDVIVFTAAHRWFFSSLDAKGDLGITTNAHEIISGETQFSEENLGGFIHTSSLTLHAGPELQRSDLDLDITRTRLEGALTFGFHLNGLYLRDENQRFGYLAGPKFTDEEYGPTPRVFLEFASSRDRLTSGVRIEVPFEFRHVNIHAPSGFTLFPSRGWVTALAPSVHYFAGYDLTRFDAAHKPLPGLGPVNVSIDGESMNARPGLGGDFPFNRFSATARSQVFWGITSAQDFLLRYSRGFGIGSSGMPIFELFRLGGTGSVRGIEEGEFVGRSLGFDQSEFGINAESLWHWLGRKSLSDHSTIPAANTNAPAPLSSADQKPAGLSALGISSVFIVGFYDRGRLARESSLGDVLNLQHALHGYGVKGELRGLHVANKLGNLSIGWARSPDSVLHRDKGVLITAFSIDF